MKVYIDTNILIDLVCSREEFLSDAQSLFSLGYAGKIQLSLSALSFINAVYISRKYRFPIQAVKQSLLSIASFTEITGLTGDVVTWALSCDWNDYEDATQYKSAISINADCIVTRNKKDYQNSDIPVYTPNEFLTMINREISS